MLSVLQISDLHRSPSDPVTNAQLIATVLHEHDQAIRAGMAPVRAIVVCGDVIQGCKLGTLDFEHELTAQYKVAKDLLSQLARELLGGDMSRLIVVPGNHDVCWNTARIAMEEASPAEHEDAYNLLQRPGTHFRWDWKDRRLYKIFDKARYVARLDAYRTFFTELYGDALPQTVNGEAWLYPVDDIIFVGFESCSGTDCFNHSAAINPDTIAHVATSLRANRARLRVAVWHHNIEGPPTTSDYLDSSSIRRLIYYGFRLGLHGHQHYAATAPLYIHTDRDQVMAVISAGSLCAGRRELPPGRSRGFNFLVIDQAEHKARVRSLAMDMEARVQPEYGFNGGSAEREVSWTAAITDGSASDATRSAILEAERANHQGRHADTVRMLLPRFSDLGEYGRTLLLDALLSEGALDEVLLRAQQLLGPENAPRVINAMLDAGRAVDASMLLERYRGVLVPDALTFFRQRLKLLEAGVAHGR